MQHWSMAATLIFLRHGQSSANAFPDSRLLPAYADDNIALTELGRAQAKDCRLRLIQEVHLDPENTTVYTSPKLRAIQTSEILGFSDRHKVDNRLAEQNIPKFSNEASRDFHRSEARRVGKFHYRYPLPGGESGEDVAVRLSSFLKDLAQNEQGNTIFIICHEVVIRAAVFLLGSDASPRVFDDVDIDNCEWVVFNCNL